MAKLWIQIVGQFNALEESLDTVQENELMLG